MTNMTLVEFSSAQKSPYSSRQIAPVPLCLGQRDEIEWIKIEMTEIEWFFGLLDLKEIGVNWEE